MPLNKGLYLRIIKPLLDFLGALLALPYLAVATMLVGPLIAAEKGTLKIFFIQYRPGQNQKLFPLIKFRTLGEKGEPGILGNFLRASSLDELPQILNILLGQMSWVGPRPLIKEYLPLYSEKEKLRFKVKPGITGLAQIEGRNAISWQERFELDLQYVNTVSLTSDLLILLQTPLVMLGVKGKHLQGNKDMDPFRGSN